MVKDSDRDKDKGKGEEDLSDIFQNLGEDFSKLIEKLAEEGEGRVDFFSNIRGLDDLDDLEGFGGLDFDSLDDLMKNLGMDSSQFGDFDTGPVGEHTKNRSKETEEEPPEGPLEPNVDVFDEGETVEVFVELPGIEEETIDLKISGTNIHLSAGEEPTRYEKEISLPVSKISSFSKHFRNGILHLSLTKGTE